MRKIFKRVIAAVATTAMVAGMMATMPEKNVEAATATTEIVLVLSDTTGISGVLLDINDGETAQNAGITCTTGTVDNTTLASWNRDMYKFVKDSSNDKVYKITVEGDVDTVANEYCNMQFLLLDNNSFKVGYKCYIQNYADIFNNNSKVYVSVDVTKGAWDDTLEMTATNPLTASDEELAAPVRTKMTAAVALDATLENKGKLEDALSKYNALADGPKALIDAGLVSQLKAKVKTVQDLQAAEDAKAAGKLTIYVKSEDNWDAVGIYGWEGAKFGDYPGVPTTACESNPGWFKATFDITKAASFVINNTKKGDTNQTVDITNVAAGTYWYTIKKSEGGKCQFEAKSTAPSGWVDEAEAKLEQVTETPDKVTTAKPNTGDVSPVMAMLALAAIAGGVVVASRKKIVSE